MLAPGGCVTESFSFGQIDKPIVYIELATFNFLRKFHSSPFPNCLYYLRPIF